MGRSRKHQMNCCDYCLMRLYNTLKLITGQAPKQWREKEAAIFLRSSYGIVPMRKSLSMKTALPIKKWIHMLGVQEEIVEEEEELA
ncbi:hypothetical protein GCM10020331_050790 [Ectobacillus funiculus]